MGKKIAAFFGVLAVVIAITVVNFSSDLEATNMCVADEATAIAMLNNTSELSDSLANLRDTGQYWENCMCTCGGACMCCQWSGDQRIECGVTGDPCGKSNVKPGCKRKVC